MNERTKTLSNPRARFTRVSLRRVALASRARSERCPAKAREKCGVRARADNARDATRTRTRSRDPRPETRADRRRRNPSRVTPAKRGVLCPGHRRGRASSALRVAEWGGTGDRSIVGPTGLVVYESRPVIVVIVQNETKQEKNRPTRSTDRSTVRRDRPTDRRAPAIDPNPSRRVVESSSR